MYLCDLAAAAQLLPQVGNKNKSGEYYITDLVALAVARKYRVRGVRCGRDAALLGVNAPRELAQMEETLRTRIVEGLLDAGVMLHAPDAVRVGPRALVEPGAELTGPCEIYGVSRVARGASVASHCLIRDCELAAGAEVRSFSHLEGAVVGPGALVGPFARLRPGAVLEEASHVGNFVELKKTRLGRGAKANHLTYLGDAAIGAGSNIGAGTITCNYDGKHKYQTFIGERAFIGSNTALVAPVSVGESPFSVSRQAIVPPVAIKSTCFTKIPHNPAPLAHIQQIFCRGRQNIIKRQDMCLPFYTSTEESFACGGTF